MGIKNVIPLILSYVLWIATIWIPYLNVGTTIAITTIPLELSKGNIINPLFIFEAKYRRYMGEYFILTGLMAIAVGAASCFLFIPAMVLSTALSLAVLLLLDKNISPIEAIMESNKRTYGYKWTIFGISFLLGLISLIFAFILISIPVIGWILYAVLFAIVCAAGSSCTAVIYRELTSESAPAPAEEE